MPIGKHKGKPIEAVLQDTQYIEWLTSQDWFREKYQNTYNIIVNNFGEPSETPEHNEMQGWFLDDEFCKKIIDYKPNLIDQKNIRNKNVVLTKLFETGRGWDVVLILDEIYEIQIDLNTYIKQKKTIKTVFIELKPQIGDDYPSILRQINNRDRGINKLRPDEDILIIYKEYTGTGITENQMREMFKHNSFKIMRKDEI